MSEFKLSKTEYLKLTAILLIAAAILFVDSELPLGIAIGMFYILPLLITFWIKNEKLSLYFSLLFTVFILAGFLKNLPTDTKWQTVIINRVFSILIVWISAFFIFKVKKLTRHIEEQKELFENTSIELFQQLETLNAAAIVSVSDKYGNIIQINDLFCDISKYKREELIGKNHSILKSGIHTDELYNDLWKTISSGNVWQGEICNKAKDGSYYWVYSTIAPFLNKNGVIEKYVSVRFDITKQKNQQEELKQANEELETFSYSVSHDLKAPLRSLEGFSKILLENYKGKFDEDADRWLQFIVDNANRMGILIDDILNFAKVSRSTINKSSINMKLIAQENFENEKVTYPQKTIHFYLENIPDSFGDVAMFHQVWQNLISNALKYSSKKEKISITISGKSENGFHIYSIKDNGTGFDEKYKEKLFGVFQRLHTNKEFEGTGVGLAIVKRIIQKHNGWITANSKPGEETEFIFALPVVRN